MNTSLRRAVATVTVRAAGLAGAPRHPPPPTRPGNRPAHAALVGTGAEEDRPGHKATVLRHQGALDGVEVRNAKTARPAALHQVRRPRGHPGRDITDLGIPLVAGGLPRAYSRTYQKGGVRGVRGVSTIGDPSWAVSSRVSRPRP